MPWFLRKAVFGGFAQEGRKVRVPNRFFLRFLRLKKTAFSRKLGEKSVLFPVFRAYLIK